MITLKQLGGCFVYLLGILVGLGWIVCELTNDRDAQIYAKFLGLFMLLLFVIGSRAISHVDKDRMPP